MKAAISPRMLPGGGPRIVNGNIMAHAATGSNAIRCAFRIAVGVGDGKDNAALHGRTALDALP